MKTLNFSHLSSLAELLAVLEVVTWVIDLMMSSAFEESSPHNSKTYISVFIGIELFLFALTPSYLLHYLFDEEH